jgi:protein tyrosine phosphatase (PTP) superfamily phosphohydrolase (DUF442 family)
MKAATRALSLSKQFLPTQTRSLNTMMSAKKLDIHSTVRMKSGYEIPVLGYGESDSRSLVLMKSTVHI